MGNSRNELAAWLGHVTIVRSEADPSKYFIERWHGRGGADTGKRSYLLIGADEFRERFGDMPGVAELWQPKSLRAFRAFFRANATVTRDSGEFREMANLHTLGADWRERVREESEAWRRGYSLTRHGDGVSLDMVACGGTPPRRDGLVERVCSILAENGVTVSREAIWHNVAAWADDCKSGYRDEENGWFVWSPCGHNSLRFDIEPLSEGKGWQETYRA